MRWKGITALPLIRISFIVLPLNLAISMWTIDINLMSSTHMAIDSVAFIIIHHQRTGVSTPNQENMWLPFSPDLRLYRTRFGSSFRRHLASVTCCRWLPFAINTFSLHRYLHAHIFFSKFMTAYPDIHFLMTRQTGRFFWNYIVPSESFYKPRRCHSYTWGRIYTYIRQLNIWTLIIPDECIS